MDDMETSSGTSGATALRRSKRDSAVKALESTLVAPSVPEETPGANSSGTTRRSQRSAKAAAPSTPTKEPPTVVERPSSGRKTVKVIDMEPVESEPAARRTRPPRAATAEPSTPTVASPVWLSPTKKEDDEEESTPGVLLTPTRNRRPSRRQLEVDEPTEKAELLLGEFSANDATALCEVVWYQIKENSHKPDVLLRDRSPSCIDWHRVAERLARSHEITLSPRACQRLWKFLAYARDTATEDHEYQPTALLADSEPEDYELTTDKINARDAVEVAQPREVNIVNPVDVGVTPVQDTIRDCTRAETSPVAQDEQPAAVLSEPVQAVQQAAESAESTAPAETSEPMEVTSGAYPQPAVPKATDGIAVHEVAEVLGPRETLRTAGIQLYPRYDQPSGVPVEMQKPFDLKHQMPLVFVAEKFLRRKVVPTRDPTSENPASSSMEVDPSILAAAAMSVTLTGEKAQPKPKKKRASEVGGEEKKPKKPRKKKEPAATSAAAKGAPAVSTAPPLVPATTKSPVPIRQAYVPSTTAPPTPTPARPALDFFGQLYKQNPGILRAHASAEEKTESEHGLASLSAPAAALGPRQIEAIFTSAPLHVQAACEQMANDDLRRFEREQLRRRLWEKARASLQNSPAPSPAAGSAPSTAATPSTPAPTPVTTSSSSVTDTTTASVAAHSALAATPATALKASSKGSVASTTSQMSSADVLSAHVP